VRAEQTVSEMVVEVLAGQAEALSKGSGRSFDEAFAEVLRTRADRQVKRPAHLREPGCGEPPLEVGDYAERVEVGEAMWALRDEARYRNKLGA
jgi:hypothetical protein